MTYEIVFNTDGTVSLPDLPAALFPVVEALGGAVPAPAQRASDMSIPAYLRSRRQIMDLAAEDLAASSTSALWALHDQMRTERRENLPATGEEKHISLLDLKTELARRALHACDLCAFHCGANRWAGESGICGSQRTSRLMRCFINWSEEPHLIPAISVELSGCNWQCPYCQYPENLDPDAGELVDPHSLSTRIETLWMQGGTHLHWIGGNPDQHLWTALTTLQASEAPVQVVWNSNGYASETTLRLLDGVVDTHLVDFRFWETTCASRYGAPADSQAVITRNLKWIAAQDTELIIRHLQLPGHFNCCTKPILDWIAAEVPQAKLNLMHGQYRPAYEAHRYPEINRRLRPDERACAQDYADHAGLKQVTNDQGKGVPE